MKSHYEGEVWGLDVVQKEDGEVLFMTSGDDNQVIAYSATQKKAICFGEVVQDEVKQKKKKKKVTIRGGASSMST
jgi:hypothetical protein